MVTIKVQYHRSFVKLWRTEVYFTAGLFQGTVRANRPGADTGFELWITGIKRESILNVLNIPLCTWNTECLIRYNSINGFGRLLCD